MAVPSRICYLKCVKNPQTRIALPHNETVMVGRNIISQIQDICVSRNHIECTANTETCTVSVKPVGKYFSGCNGFALMKNHVYEFGSDSRLEIRLGFHEYDIVFEPPASPLSESEKNAKKRKVENSESDTSENEKGKWRILDNKDLIVYTTPTYTGKSLIAAFDLDSTLIKTKSGHTFPKNVDDWVFNYSEVPKKLKELYDNDYKIVIFTNQAKLDKNTQQIKQFQEKIEAILAKFKIFVHVFIAPTKSYYRKPSPGMWYSLTETFNDNVKVDMEKSFYVGDAAGRKKNWAPNKKQDHSCADRLFALNVGLQFFTPEEYFLNKAPADYVMPQFDPRNFTASQIYPDIEFSEQEVILMVGYQGSGKSYYCRNQLIPKGFVHVSRDKLKSWEKCVSELKRNIELKKSVVIDNVNINKEARRRYIDVCKEYGVKCRCFVMDVDFLHAKHNNKFRQLIDNHQSVGDAVLFSTKSKFEEPDLSEGFSDIIRIPFVPTFPTEKREKFYRMFLLES